MAHANLRSGIFLSGMQPEMSFDAAVTIPCPLERLEDELHEAFISMIKACFAEIDTVMLADIETALRSFVGVGAAVRIADHLYMSSELSST